jgi:hypothetical protein
MLMGECLDLNIGQGQRLQPAQDAQLGVSITQAIGHHDANQRLDIDAVASVPKDTAQV